MQRGSNGGDIAWPFANPVTYTTLLNLDIQDFRLDDQVFSY